VAIRFTPFLGAPPVVAVEDQIMQVCLNLGLNALDAVATNPESRPRSLAVHTSCVERGGKTFVRTEFIDSGPGIPESVRSRVFQPFFTTKERGKGTGMGLPVSYNIIEEHQGTLGFECGDVAGTTFYFELPVEPSSASRATESA
jgi:C4-dicarboxylate-specific signal transduction histidine kinase